MQICFFGTYSLEHTNLLLKKNLELQGIEVVDCRAPISKNIFSLISSYPKLLIKNRRLRYDIILIPLWKGTLSLPLIKIISRKPIVYFAYSSPYDGFVFDRKIHKPNSIYAKFLFFLEKFSCKLSDLVIKETDAEIEHFGNQIGVSTKKFKKLFINANEELFKPLPFKPKNSSFKILYFGNFIPLHGVITIIETAKLLAKNNDIFFEFIGDGQMKEEMEKLSKNYGLKNVKFFGFVEDKVLIEHIKNSDICLGIFGNSKKAGYVITNKVSQILCSQKPLITRESKAIREISLENNKNCILIPKNDPSKLSAAILDLKENEVKRKEISIEGRRIYEKYLTADVRGKTLLNYLNKLLEK